MDVLKRIEVAGILPVVVIDNVETALPTAKALKAGGIDAMEITFRTAVAADAIKTVVCGCPEMLVGAGTVLTIDQCKKAIEAGAKFIVSPGYCDEVVDWCIHNEIAIFPGCVTPTEIMKAKRSGLNVVKFFPADINGGLNAMKALAAPFSEVKFILTGGINETNLADMIVAPFVHAVGGSWVCSKQDIAANNYEKIEALARKARRAAMGFEVAHIGINTANEEEADEICATLNTAFDFEIKDGKKSKFAGCGVEVLKCPFLGHNGHIAIKTNSALMAAAELERRGFPIDYSNAKYNGDIISALYLKNEIGGFAVHLLQK